MSESFDWGEVNFDEIALAPVERKVAAKLVTVPEPILNMAQKLWSQNMDKQYPYSFRGKPESVAVEFANHARNSGAHVTPNPVTIIAKQDGITVTVYATTKRGRKSDADKKQEKLVADAEKLANQHAHPDSPAAQNAPKPPANETPKPTPKPPAKSASK